MYKYYCKRRRCLECRIYLILSKVRSWGTKELRN
jgi:hypothetical protein